MKSDILIIHWDYVFEYPDFPLGINFNRFHPDYPDHDYDYMYRCKITIQ